MPDLWQRVDRLIDRAPSDDDVRSHRLEPLAARRFRETGRDVPPDFAEQARLAAIASMAAPLLLERIRSVYDGPLVVLKGPEVAAAYPAPSLRNYGDLDLLVPEAKSAHAAMIGAGFEEVGDAELYVDIHHLRPLAVPELPLHVELHTSPKWLDGVSPPSTDELLAATVPSRTLEGVLALAPDAHALVLAAHSWAHEPLRRLRDLVDVAAVAAEADGSDVAARAGDWGVSRLWATTRATVDALFGDAPRPWALRLWAQNLDRLRERTVLENHLQRLLSDFWALPPATAVRRVPRRIADDLGPEADERWREKLARSAHAVRNASTPRSRHDREREDRRARRDGS